jgi:hypothetical protein
MPHTLDLKRLPEIVEHINENSERLNVKEMSFMESVNYRVENKIELTESMLEWLEAIYCRMP